MTDPSADPAKGRLFETIVEKTSEGVWAIDAQRLTTYVNQSMADMLGYSRDELVASGAGVGAQFLAKPFSLADVRDRVLSARDFQRPPEVLDGGTASP
ncbi:MAG TPA: PAS domain-containing protein [Labilithrix sp.]|nr:PAS domain-containing protein [Labilithrix sp.]